MSSGKKKGKQSARNWRYVSMHPMMSAVGIVYVPHSSFKKVAGIKLKHTKREKK